MAFYNGSTALVDDYDPDTWETNNYKIFDPNDMTPDKKSEKGIKPYGSGGTGENDDPGTER